MAIPTALLVKGGVGVAAVATPVSTYFIIDGMNKKKLREENVELNEKITALGIADTTCHFEDIKDKAGCELDETKVKAINFSNKTTDSATFQISGLSSNKKLVLVIEKGYKDTDFPEGLRFIFKNTSTETSGDVTIGSSSDSNKITLKANTSYDFKMKSDDKTKLEKAWTITTLGAKVGLTCTNGDSTECDLKAEGINVWKNETDYITGAKGDTTKKMCFVKDQKDYLEGFKFTVSEDIALTVDGNNGSGISKLIKDNMSYGIDVKDIGGIKTWFLVEKSTSVPQESQ